MPAWPTIAVYADPPGEPALRELAAAVAADLGLPLAGDLAQALEHDLVLAVTAVRLELRVVSARAKGRRFESRPLVVDPAQVDTASGAGRSLQQPLAKALGLRRGVPWRPVVIDATAGWGGDSLLMAGLGCRVLAVERSPVVALLLADGLGRAAARGDEAAARITPLLGDARQVLEHVETLPESGPGGLSIADQADFAAAEVVYLDPMFPPGRKTAERKAMQVLRQLVGGDEDAPQLLAAALHRARRRVVVKRPRKAPPLKGPPPTVRHEGKSLRYDVYAVGAMRNEA